MGRRLGVVGTQLSRTNPAGCFDYDRNGARYSLRRAADPRIADYIHAALADARTVLNVGAGSGSYEPTDRYVAAVEPSAIMRAQRPPHLCPAIDSTAEHLPFDDATFDAVMAINTIHHWRDQARGFTEMSRVSRKVVLALTFDPEVWTSIWLAQYSPELTAVTCRRLPRISDISAVLGDDLAVTPVPIPIDCVDGFIEAYYARPESFLSDEIRQAQSGWGLIGADAERRAVNALRVDLESGAWDQRFGHLRRLRAYEGSLRLVVARRG